jgi:hypothetical protein
MLDELTHLSIDFLRVVNGVILGRGPARFRTSQVHSVLAGAVSNRCACPPTARTVAINIMVLLTVRLDLPVQCLRLF